MSYNMKNRNQSAAETRKKIVDSASRLFAENNYDTVSVNDIVEAAGVAKGSFYVHFTSKDALIAALINENVADVDMDYQAFLDTCPEDMPASDVLLALIGKIADVLIEKIGCDKMKAIYKAQITKDVDAQAVMDYNRALYSMFASVLEKGVQKGEFRTELSIHELTRQFLLAIRGITYEWCIRYPDFDYKEQSLLHIGLLIKGILA